MNVYVVHVITTEKLCTCTCSHTLFFVFFHIYPQVRPIGFTDSSRAYVCNSAECACFSALHDCTRVASYQLYYQAGIGQLDLRSSKATVVNNKLRRTAHHAEVVGEARWSIICEIGYCTLHWYTIPA